MKRCSHSKKRSTEYKTALDLARMLKHATETLPDEILKRWVQAMQEWWRTELLHRIQVEETTLLPALGAVARNGVAERTIKEHRELEDLVYDSDLPCRVRLARFADLLSAHVRFEETLVFRAE